MNIQLAGQTQHSGNPLRLRDLAPGMAFGEAARALFAAGFPVIPIIPEKKSPAVRWDPWLPDLSAQTIEAHWAQHPDHQLGFIVDERTLVLDADSPESSAAVLRLEAEFGVKSNFTVRTSRGGHHYYRLAEGALARTQAFDTEKQPQCIDVKANRSVVVMPPSTNKTIVRCEIDHIEQLTVVGQDFVDAVYRHNGKEPPRKAPDLGPAPEPKPIGDLTERVRHLAAMLQHLDSDGSYDEWIKVGMALHHETGGSEEGFAVFNEWSARGRKYPGESESRQKWASLDGYTGTRITAGTLRAMLREKGLDPNEVIDAAEPQFERIEVDATKAKPVDAQTNPAQPAPAVEITPELLLTGYSITGSLKKLRKEMLEQVYLLDGLALMGEATVLYAAPNTGKTLLVLWMLMQAIKQGRLDPAKVFYINCDDSMRGLVQKGEIAAAHGFHMIADGHQGFEARKLREILAEVMDRGQASGVVIVLDTLKKFTDLMDKTASTGFMKHVRKFVLNGGTVVMLAHTNKKEGADGKPVYAGTTDIIDDADCAHIMRSSSPVGAAEKIVEFERRKTRGDVAQQATFAYSGVDGLTYDKLLASVRRVDPHEANGLHHAAAVQADAKYVEIVKDCIRSGVVQRMKLVELLMLRGKCSRNDALALLDKYTGEDLLQHHWTFDVKAKGAKVYRLLTLPGDSPASQTSTDASEAGHE